MGILLIYDALRSKDMKKAFTLVELIITLSLIGLLLCIMTPITSSITEAIKEKRFQGTSMELLEDIRHARVRAITNGEVQMSFVDGGYQLTDTYNKYSYKNETFPDGMDIDFKESTIPGDKRIKFMNSGAINPYACTIVLKDSYGRCSCISIKVGTFTIDFKKTNP